MTDDREAVEIVARWLAKEAGHDPDQPDEGLGNLPTWTLYAQDAADLLGTIRAAGFPMAKPVPDEGLRETVELAVYRNADVDARASRRTADAILPLMLAREAALRSERDAATTRCVALEAALEPSVATKAAYSGEIEVTIDCGVSDYGDSVSRKILLPWIVIKQVMAMIRERAARANVTADRSDAP